LIGAGRVNFQFLVLARGYRSGVIARLTGTHFARPCGSGGGGGGGGGGAMMAAAHCTARL